MITSVVRIKTPISKNIIQSILPDEECNERVRTKIELKGGKIIIETKAKDIVAFRASINTELRLINSLEKIKKVIG